MRYSVNVCWNSEGHEEQWAKIVIHSKFTKHLLCVMCSSGIQGIQQWRKYIKIPALIKKEREEGKSGSECESMGIERRKVSHFKLTGMEGLPRDLKGEIIHGDKKFQRKAWKVQRSWGRGLPSMCEQYQAGHGAREGKQADKLRCQFKGMGVGPWKSELGFYSWAVNGKAFKGYKQSDWYFAANSYWASIVSQALC